MLTLVFSLFLMVVTTLALQFLVGWPLSWCIFLGAVIAFIVQIGIGFWLRRNMAGVVSNLQLFMQNSSEELNRKYTHIASRGKMNRKQLQEAMQKDQAAIFTQAAEQLQALEKFFPWSLGLRKQVNSMNLQFFFQMKQYDKVDQLLPQSSMSDPVIVCMKMCRHYLLGQDDELAKTYKKYHRKFKMQSVMIYATYSWMLVRKNRIDDALKVLVDGKNNTENKHLAANWEKLANDRIKQFSNHPFGETWYSLGLEEAK